MSPLALSCVKQDLAKEATRRELCPRSGPGAPWFKASVCQWMKNGRCRERRGLAEVKHIGGTRGEEGNRRAWPASPHRPLPSAETQVPADPEGTQPLGRGARGGHALQLPHGRQQHARETHAHHRGDHEILVGPGLQSFIFALGFCLFFQLSQKMLLCVCVCV